MDAVSFRVSLVSRGSHGTLSRTPGNPVHSVGFACRWYRTVTQIQYELMVRELRLWDDELQSDDIIEKYVREKFGE